MIYLLQVSTCWILFYSIYAVFLKKETFFSVNRYYLLGALFTGLVIPLIGQLLPANSASTEVYGAMYAVTLPVVEPMAAEQSPLFTWTRAFWLAYGLGAVVVASRVLHGLHRIWHIYQSGERTQKDGYTLVQSTVRHLPFSFFNCIFISKSVRLKGDIEHVLRHEELHVNQWHSLDTLLLEVLHVFFWFNPILIFYKRAIKQSHEYLADAYVSGVHEKYSYGQLLLGQSTSGLEIALANQFFNSQIKKRIKMMYKERSKKQAMVKYFAVVPVLLIALFIFSSSTNTFDKEQVKQEITDYFATELLDLDDVATYVNTLAETHSQNREALRNLFSELNPIGGFTVDINQVGEKFSTCVYLSDNDKKAPTGLYGAYVIKVDALLQQRGAIGDGKLAQEIARVTETYLSQKLSRKRVEGYLASQGMRYSIDTKGNVDFLAFKRPFQGRNTNVTVYLTTTTTIVNGVEVSDREAVQREIIKLTKGTNTKKIDLIADGAVTNTKTMEVLDMCSELGLQVHVSTPSAEEKEKDRIIEDLREFGERITVKDTTWKPASKFTFPSGMGSFRIQLKDHQTVVLKSDKMIYKQGVDYDVDRKNGIIKLADLSAIDSDETLTVYLLDENKDDDVVTLIAYGEADDGIQGDPIIVVNGRMVEKAQYEQLKPEDIASVSVLKGEAAIAKYGEKGKAGVIEVTLKNEHSWISFLDEEPYKVVEHMPRFPGCEDNEGTPKEKEDCGKHEMLKYIYTNINYPAEARDKGVEGMVVVQFVVNKDGSVTGAKVVRDIGGGTAPEVVRIVESMPKWIPGRQNGEVVNVLYTLPVRFKLESEEEEEEAAEPLEVIDTNYGLGQQTSPLYLLNGKRIDKAEIADIEGVIVGIHVLKAEEALRKYGDAAKEGAVEITTKTKQAYDQEEYTELLELRGPIVYPQPNDGNFRVYFKTESSSPVTINIYGASGNAIKVFDGIIPEQGTVEQQVELAAFTDGAAFLSIIQDGKIYTEKLILQH